MGKKLQLVSDPKLAKPHEAGAVVELIQPVVHNQFGAINFIAPQFYPYHFNRAEKAFQKLDEFQDKILALPIESDNSRMISDFEFLGNIYDAGFDMVVHLYLGFDHFLLNSLMYAVRDPQRRKQINNWEVMMRLNYALKNIFNRKDLINSAGYSKFAEIEKIRHAFNHPTTRRVYNGNPGEWDEVPLAWVISGKYKEAYEEARKLFEELSKIWEIEKKKYDQPGSIINAQRGIKSLHQTKKSTNG